MCARCFSVRRFVGDVGDHHQRAGVVPLRVSDRARRDDRPQR